MAKWNLNGISCTDTKTGIKNETSLDDGRPYNTDQFLVHIIEHEDDLYGLRDRISDWLHGDWEAALDELPELTNASS